jgi:hypothetical protein
LILVNDGVPILSPEIAMFFLAHILKSSHSAIQHVVYCSMNIPVQVEGQSAWGPFWSSADIPNRATIPDAFLTRLSRCWQTALDEAYGMRIPMLAFPNLLADDMRAVQFERASKNDRSDRFLVPGQFYRSKKLGHHYYCDSVGGGTARIFLVESYRNGELIQALYDQKLIWSEDYMIIEDPDVLRRLRTLLAVLKKNNKGIPREKL